MFKLRRNLEQASDAFNVFCVCRRYRLCRRHKTAKQRPSWRVRRAKGGKMLAC
ncbi:MAG: hypothetical protein ACKFI0_00280 [Candidatus Hodgkinia cicadicola]